MNKIYLAIITLFIGSLTYGQSFEGKLTYFVEFDIKSQTFGDFEITKEQIVDKMKKDGDFFDTITITIKEGNYVKEDNSNSKKRILYKSEFNNIYTFQKDFEYVTITDANKFNTMNLDLNEPKIEQIDSLKIINGINCKRIKFSWGKSGEESYYYNSAIAKINPNHFSKHNYEYFNTLIGITSSYPLEIIKTISNIMSIKMTLISILEEKIDDSIFELPKLKKAEKDYSEMMLKITGSKVMKIK